jgi:hypothetical protein
MITGCPSQLPEFVTPGTCWVHPLVLSPCFTSFPFPHPLAMSMLRLFPQTLPLPTDFHSQLECTGSPSHCCMLGTKPMLLHNLLPCSPVCWHVGLTSHAPCLVPLLRYGLESSIVSTPLLHVRHTPHAHLSAAIAEVRVGVQYSQQDLQQAQQTQLKQMLWQSLLSRSLWHSHLKAQHYTPCTPLIGACSR